MTTYKRSDSQTYLLPELVRPVPEPSGLDTPFWSAVRSEQLLIQRCQSCSSWQWGPNWTCYSCQSFNVSWEEVPRSGQNYVGAVYSWERVWHPTNEQLGPFVPYVVVLVNLPTAGDVRMMGNLTGSQTDPIHIGGPLQVVFEHHDDYTLVQWERAS
jgi:uncharacterized OB-fold protein